METRYGGENFVSLCINIKLDNFADHCQFNETRCQVTCWNLFLFAGRIWRLNWKCGKQKDIWRFEETRTIINHCTFCYFVNKYENKPQHSRLRLMWTISLNTLGEIGLNRASFDHWIIGTNICVQLSGVNCRPIVQTTHWLLLCTVYKYLTRNDKIVFWN